MKSTTVLTLLYCSIMFLQIAENQASKEIIKLQQEPLQEEIEDANNILAAETIISDPTHLIIHRIDDFYVPLARQEDESVITFKRGGSFDQEKELPIETEVIITKIEVINGTVYGKYKDTWITIKTKNRVYATKFQKAKLPKDLIKYAKRDVWELIYQFLGVKEIFSRLVRINTKFNNKIYEILFDPDMNKLQIFQNLPTKMKKYFSTVYHNKIFVLADEPVVFKPIVTPKLTKISEQHRRLIELCKLELELEEKKRKIYGGQDRKSADQFEEEDANLSSLYKELIETPLLQNEFDNQPFLPNVIIIFDCNEVFTYYDVKDHFLYHCNYPNISSLPYILYLPMFFHFKFLPESYKHDVWYRIDDLKIVEFYPKSRRDLMYTLTFARFNYLAGCVTERVEFSKCTKGGYSVTSARKDVFADVIEEPTFTGDEIKAKFTNIKVEFIIDY